MRFLGVPIIMLKYQQHLETHLLHRAGHSIRGIRQITLHDRKTIRNILTAPVPWATPEKAAFKGQPANPRRYGRRSSLEPFKDFLLGKTNHGVNTARLLSELRSRGFSGSLRSLQRFLHAHKVKTVSTLEQMMDWMHLVVQGARTSSQIQQDVGSTLTHDEVTTLLACVRTKPLKLRNRALALLAHGNGISPGHIASFLCVTRATARTYVAAFKEGGIQGVLDLSRKEVKKSDDPNFAAAVFKTLHAPPSAFGFNRTTWRMDDL